MFLAPSLCTSLAHLLSRVLICLDDIDVARAAAQVAGDRVTNFVVAWLAVLFQKREAGHQHAGGAVAALQAVFLKEAVLEWMQFAVLLETFDRGDGTSISLDGEDRARLNRASIQHDCTRAAVTRVAADVRAGEPEGFA